MYTFTKAYTYGDSGQLLAFTQNGKKYFYHYNAQGDVIAISDSTGKTVAKYQYDAWGNPTKTEASDEVKDNRYRYAGYQYDEETGLYYLMARYYEPRNGVFLSLDPDPGSDGDSLDQNGYAYGNNNPVMNVDPDGHWVWLVVNAGFAAYDGYKAYKSGKGWKSVAWAAASNFGPGKVLKGAKKVLGVAKGAKKYLKPGKYAKRSIPARSTSSRLNKKERRVLNKIGNKYGCHTCGRRHPGTKSGNWIADHQPVSKLRKKGQRQRLYPHCQTCSGKQGGYTSSILRKRHQRR
ncbi:tRNA(Glu)-specific nuclease WapA [Bacillus subtilis]|nr:tRNA(Glu)-specific nuclease WapA [Bacillus subtilis]